MLDLWRKAQHQAEQIVSLYRAAAPRDFDPQNGKGGKPQVPEPPAPPAPTDAANNRALRLRQERLIHAKGYESTFLTRQQKPLGENDTLLNKLLGG